MKTAQGFVPGDNAQAAVDAASQMIVAQQVPHAPNDQQPLAPWSRRARRTPADRREQDRPRRAPARPPPSGH